MGGPEQPGAGADPADSSEPDPECHESNEATTSSPGSEDEEHAAAANHQQQQQLPLPPLQLRLESPSSQPVHECGFTSAPLQSPANALCPDQA